jgi:hypothetical protein
MKTMKGPALFLAQFAGDVAPFDSWGPITKWAANRRMLGLGDRGQKRGFRTHRAPRAMFPDR